MTSDGLGARVRRIEASLAGPASLAVHARDADTGRTLLAVRADEPSYAASLMKLPVLIAVARALAASALSLAEELPVHEGFASAVPGRAFTMDQTYDQDPDTWAARGTTATVADLALRMTAWSSNIATNLLLERVGLDAAQQVLADAGCSPETAVRRGIEDAPARDAGLDNRCTAADLTTLLTALHRGTVIGEPQRSWVLDLLARQVYRDGIPAGVPSTARVANKTGSVDGLNHDVALIGVEPAPGGPRTLALAVLCTAGGTEEEREAALADVTRLVWSEWSG